MTPSNARHIGLARAAEVRATLLGPTVFSCFVTSPGIVDFGNTLEALIVQFGLLCLDYGWAAQKDIFTVGVAECWYHPLAQSEAVRIEIMTLSSTLSPKPYMLNPTQFCWLPCNVARCRTV